MQTYRISDLCICAFALCSIDNQLIRVVKVCRLSRFSWYGVQLSPFQHFGCCTLQWRVPWILRSLRRRRWSPQILNIRLDLEFVPVLIWCFGIELNRDFAVLACTRCSHLAFRHYGIKSVRNFQCPWLWRSTPRPAYNSMPTEVGDGRAGHASPSWQEESHFAVITATPLRFDCCATSSDWHSTHGSCAAIASQLEQS